jgi:hypothetical protein
MDYLLEVDNIAGHSPLDPATCVNCALAVLLQRRCATWCSLSTTQPNNSVWGESSAQAAGEGTRWRAWRVVVGGGEVFEA